MATVFWDAKAVIFLQFCLYGSWDSLGPEFMHPKLKLCIQPGTCGEIFCCVPDFSFKLNCVTVFYNYFLCILIGCAIEVNSGD